MIRILDEKISKQKLLELGRQLVDIKEEARKVSKQVDEFNARNQEVIDEVDFGTRYLDEAIESIHEKLGELELNESLGGRKK